VCVLPCCIVCYVQGYGDGASITDASTAKDVFLGTGVYATAISASDYNTCAILSNKQYCAGDTTAMVSQL
jgi:hypothetical protein